MSRLIKVLSIDGGGIRGIIPTLILKYIEDKTGKHTSQIFDLISGTSTGGIRALGLTIPDDEGNPKYTAKDMVKFYEQESPIIYNQTFLQKIVSIPELKLDAKDPMMKLKILDQSAGGKYSSEGIDKVLKRVFGNARLKDALTDVIIPAYDIERRRSIYFKSSNARESDDQDFIVREVARATSAGPTFYEPCKIETADGSYLALIDGGVFANNPTMCAYIEAKTKCNLHDKWGVTDVSDLEFLIVSLGTGQFQARIPLEKARSWSAIHWGLRIWDLTNHGMCDTVHHQMMRLFDDTDEGRDNNECGKYYRFQANLDQDSIQIDNFDPDNLQALKVSADNLIRNEIRKQRHLIKQLKD